MNAPDSFLCEAKRLVLKLGTQVVTDAASGRVAQERLEDIVDHSARWVRDGKEVILVTSGAVGLGKTQLKLSGPLDLPGKQACAAVGQGLLMHAYQELFSRHGLTTAQLLLTAEDFSSRARYLNLQKTLERLLSLGVVPIINENDPVATAELEEDQDTKSFGDNDKLSALVAGKLAADLLILLTNVEGLYTEDPRQNPQSERISVIQRFEDLTHIRLEGLSEGGRGGMASKLEAARIAAISGVATVITSGLEVGALGRIFGSPEAFPGTLILPYREVPSGKKRWIGLASGYSGVVVVNDGARKALTERFSSLLPVGITAVRGDFQPHDVVSVQDEAGTEIGRGIAQFSAEDTRSVMGRPGYEIPQRLGQPDASEEVIHRDNLVIFSEYQPS